MSKRTVKKLTIYKRPGVSDYARAAAAVNDVNNNHIAPLIAAGASALAPKAGKAIGEAVGGIFGGKKYTADQQAFYNERDRVYALINAKYGKAHYEKLPGNPFAQWAHQKGKNPLGSMNSIGAFYNMVEQYYPGLLSNSPGTAAQQSVIKPLNGVMTDGIAATGNIPPKTTSGKTEEFIDKIVSPATGQSFAGAGGEALENAAIEFIGTLVQKKKDGEQLPPIYDKIASGAMQVENKLNNKVKQTVDTKIGSAITGNMPLILLGGAALVGLYFFTRK